MIECERCLHWVPEWFTFEARAGHRAVTLDACLECSETPWRVLASDIAAGRVRVYARLRGCNLVRIGRL